MEIFEITDVFPVDEGLDRLWMRAEILGISDIFRDPKNFYHDLF